MRLRFLPLALLLFTVPTTARSGQDAAPAQAIASRPWLIEPVSESFRSHSAQAPRDLRGAVESLLEAIRPDLDRASFLRRRADKKRLRGDTEGAVADFTEAVRLDPSSAETFFMRGFTRRDLGDWTGALADYNEAIRLRPGYADAHALRSTARTALGDAAGAKTDVEEAIRLDPNNLYGFNNRGLLRYAEADFAGAAADHGRAIRIDPTFVRAWRNRANARSYLGDKEGALADYDEALRLEPDHAEARIGRAWIRRAVGDLERALDDYLVARRLPDAEGVPANLCITLFRLGRREEAVQSCKAGQREAADGDAKPFATEAGVLLLADDTAGAEAALAEALRRDPRSAHALRLRSVIHARRGDWAAADRDIVASQEIAPWMELLVREAYGHALFR